VIQPTQTTGGEEGNYVLQLTESLTGRSCALRIEAHAAKLTLSELLRTYFQCCPVERLVEEGRLTASSAETLQAFQDLVYTISDSGRLGDVLKGVVFRQGGEPAPLDRPPDISRVRAGGKDVSLIDVEIDRMNVGYDRNWAGFHSRRWERHADLYEVFVVDALRKDHAGDEVEAVLKLATEEQQITLLRSLARRIWESQFENYSRFLGDKIRFKAGDETVRNIVDGRGGICAEKVQALKFLTDHYGLHSEYVIAGPNTPTPVPEEELRDLLNTFDFEFSKRFMRYWDHTALLYTFDDTAILVDATNGNIPFLFLENIDADRLLGYEDKQSLRVRMSVNEEAFYYHRVAQDIPENLFFAMEGWISDVDLMQVFENELGLYISEDWFVMPIAFKSAAEYDSLKQRYLQVCKRAGLACDVSDGWALDTPLGRQFSEEEADVSESVELAGDYLLRRYDDWEGDGHDGAIVTVALRSAEKVRTGKC
jgi:hypothetical protein